MNASVVIPSWNGAALLSPTLEHLLQIEGLDFAKGLNFEILVVDHGRLNRDSEKVVNAFSARDSRIRYLGLDEQLGYAGAVNYGAERAKYPLVAVLCNDVLVEKDWLAELVKKFAERKNLGQRAVVSSLVTRPGFDNPLGTRLNLWGRIVRTGETQTRPEDYLPLFPDGSAFLFDKEFLGLPFDAEYFLYQEDVSLGWREWLWGGEVVMAPRSRALNADGGTTRRTPFKAAYFTERNRWLNAFIYFSLPTLLRVLPLLWMDALLRLAAGSNRRAKVLAWAWLLVHPGKIWSKRASAQKRRQRLDREIFPLISLKYWDSAGLPAKCLNGFCAAYAKITFLN